MNVNLGADVLHGLRQEYVPPEKLPTVMRVLHGSNMGDGVVVLEGIAASEEYDIQGYSLRAASEETRSQRIVRIGLIQNKIAEPTTSPFRVQTKVDRILIDLHVQRLCPGIVALW